MSGIRLVIADVDGTLVNDHRELSSYTKSVIERLHEQGILFGVASGRDYLQLLEDNEYWGFDFPFDVTMGMNGGQVYIAETRKLYEYNKLSEETVKSIVEMMDPLELAGVGVCLKNGAQDTKACADYITEFTNNEDGFAKFAEKLL